MPLPLGNAFTYNIPAHLTDKVQVGCRVNVPFGAKKQYAALVIAVHGSPSPQCTRANGEQTEDTIMNNELRTMNYKDILDVLDDHPMLLTSQLELWKWVAEYYLCTVGEVYKAAIPSGLKDKDGETNYHPKTVSCVRITDAFFNTQKVNEIIAALHSASKQQLLLMRYVELSGLGETLSHTPSQGGVRNKDMLKEITREELLKASSVSPQILRAVCERGVLEIYEKQVSRLTSHIPSDWRGDLLMPVLSDAQGKAYDEILDFWQKHRVTLLHGVTGSGKTEIYIHLIQDAISHGKQVLYLLPEIVLTSQLTDRLRRVFGDRLGVYHSKYTDAERVEVYQKQVSAEPYDIIVGVRSSVLLPFQRLGLVIVDEEHETSFKQQEPAPRYHARNTAIVLAAQQNAKVLLGTATPSLESYYNARYGKYGLVTLTTRFRDVLLPEIEVVDIHDLKRKKMMSGPFSPLLLKEMRGALERKEQIILFQNRRGFAPMVECNVCGWVPQCPHCDVSLTYHKRLNQLTCHYCGYSTPIPQRCPQCGADNLYNKGYGTERIEDIISRIFPEARIARMDLDTTRSRQAYEGIIHDFQKGRTDILVGTQMVTKGLDFQRVSVVGILNAGTMLNQPDFRSYERAFQMMSQVAGRAGRHSVRGRVILQTTDATNPVIGQVVRNDYEALFQDQIEERNLFQYPPLCHLVYVYMKHKDEQVLDHLAMDMARMLRQVFGTRVLGPDTPPVARVQMLFIRKVCLKVELTGNMSEARQRLRQIQSYLQGQPAYRSATIYYDVD